MVYRKPVVVFCLVMIFLSSIARGQEGNREVIARSGDGIHKLLKESGLDPYEYTEKFIELNKSNIGADNTLFAGRKYYIPLPEGALETTSGAKKVSNGSVVREYDIFGKEYSRVEITDNTLAGTVYYLMSGHGGPDPGASGKYGPYTLTEDEYAYDVTLRLARDLISHGALVYMITRDNNDGIRDESILKKDNDEQCYPANSIPVNQMARLRQRTETVNRLYAGNRGRYQRLIVIHLDSRSNGENIDVFFYHHQNSANGKKLAESIHNTFREKYRQFQPNRTYRGSVSTRSGLYVVRNTDPPTVFIELGNIRNARDQRRFVIYDNRQALANWIYDGIIADYNDR